ncbi:hypothetical protein ABK040_002025 [Willaertia magna]
MEAKEMIKRHEGLVLHVYKDSLGYDTIGYGHLITTNETFPEIITKEQAEELFEKDFKIAYEGAQTIVSNFNNLNNVRQAVLIDMCFNLGVTKLLNFKKMIAAIEKEDFTTAAKEMKNSKWFLQVGKRAEELSTMMEKGE